MSIAHYFMGGYFCTLLIRRALKGNCVFSMKCSQCHF
uniref:Fructose-1 6-bisphosphatase n=1 Tax=Rhizophora mucronata TaxID=61149 RepID=A0A2P2LM94_RHIMU